MVLLALLVMRYAAMGQAPKSAELLSKRYTIYHTIFKGNIDLYRATFSDIKMNLNENAPEIFDSIALLYAMNSSPNKAYCPATGFTIEQVGTSINISEVQEQSHAFSGGIRNGQSIQSIHGIAPMNMKHAWELLNSKKTINLITRRDKAKKTSTFQRDDIAMKPLRLVLANRSATLQFHSLNKSMLKEYVDMSSSLRTDNIDTIVIDLRNILGLGNLKTVLSIADEYIPDNIDIMVIHSATGSYTYTSSGNAKFADIPLKVLIDSSTSGYGLLLAGLLTIYEKAELIGSPTSKDGRLHTIYKVHDNPSYYVRIPIHDYFIADDIVLNGVGLIPKKSTPEKQELTVNN
jgi:carboxyl-terminal processing protease